MKLFVISSKYSNIVSIFEKSRDESIVAPATNDDQEMYSDNTTWNGF